MKITDFKKEDWNTNKIKSVGIDGFKAIVSGYAKDGKIDKPTDKQIEGVFQTITGIKLKTKND